MELGTLAAMLETEHHEIDDLIEDYLLDHDPVPLRRGTAELRRHIYVEEELIFPALRAAGLMAPVLVMLREHGELWRTLDTLDAALDGQQSARAATLCQELLDLLQRHNAKEEPILYPRVDGVLDTAGTDTALGLLDGGEMPPAWTCQMADN